ncbi:MAG: hypothetical protein H0X65_21310 [Gemmatimonadetes bacterium]|nr:hypothetical protein [Gemmatimonadota bacterium]
MARIEQFLNRMLMKRSRATFETADRSLALICAVSREHERGGVPSYWFAFHPHQRDFLAAAPEAHVAFGCGSPDAVLLISFGGLPEWLERVTTSGRDERLMVWRCSGRCSRCSVP